jgi:hypothetical protein
VLLLLLAMGAVVAGVAVGLGGRSSSSSDVAAKPYFCPMHAEVRSAQPGECPICRMALQKQAATSRLDLRYMTDVDAVENIRRHNILDFVKHRSLLFFLRELRGPAWVDSDGTINAVFYTDQVAVLSGDETGTFSPTATPTSTQEVRRTADAPVAWDRSTSRIRFRATGAAGPPPGQVGWLELAPRPRQILSVAASSVLQDAQGPYVLAWTGHGFTFERRRIEIGETFLKQGWAVVLSGLKLNDRVVARAAFFVDADRRSQAREQMTWEAP